MQKHFCVQKYWESLGGTEVGLTCGRRLSLTKVLYSYLMNFQVAPGWLLFKDWVLLSLPLLMFKWRWCRREGGCEDKWRTSAMHKTGRDRTKIKKRRRGETAQCVHREQEWRCGRERAMDEGWTILSSVYWNLKQPNVCFLQVSFYSIKLSRETQKWTHTEHYPDRKHTVPISAGDDRKSRLCCYGVSLKRLSSRKTAVVGMQTFE